MYQPTNLSKLFHRCHGVNVRSVDWQAHALLAALAAHEADRVAAWVRSILGNEAIATLRAACEQDSQSDRDEDRGFNCGWSNAIAFRAELWLAQSVYAALDRCGHLRRYSLHPRSWIMTFAEKLEREHNRDGQ